MTSTPHLYTLPIQHYRWGAEPNRSQWAESRKAAVKSYDWSKGRPKGCVDHPHRTAWLPPSGYLLRVYQSDEERTKTLTRIAEQREGIISLQSACTTRYQPESGSQIDAWWSVVPQRVKQRHEAAIRREKKYAKEWLSKAEAKLLKKGTPLPKEGDGRDSTNIQSYAEFFDHSVDLGDSRDDHDGGYYSRQSDMTCEPERRDIASLNDTASEKFYAGSTSTLNQFEEISGPLTSSWQKVEDHAAGLYRKKSLGAKFTIKQDRCEPERVPDYVLRRTTKLCWNEETREFHEVPFEEFNPYDNAARESIAHRFYHKSPPKMPVGVEAEMIPGRPLSQPPGTIREWSGDKDDPSYQAWLHSGNYDGLAAFRESLQTPE